VAEDNLMNQQVALLLLGAMGYHADVVGDGDDAIAAVRGAPYDVVLMDIAMPGTDGLSATRAIRSLRTEVHQPYVVALTAHAFPGDADKCLDAGMDDFVAKPIDRAQLARALEAGARAAKATHEEEAARKRPGLSRAPVPAPPTEGPGMPGDDGFEPAMPMDILRQFGLAPFADLVAIFRTESHRLVAAAGAAVAVGDIEQAERAAHTLKSSAANLGAQGLYETCTRLEALARSGTLDTAAGLAGTMAAQLDSALGHLDAMVADNGIAGAE
jgi:CheY-like chemotaxis protein/HPt (histidine-containing phosphotransfer) domain-containing protein